MKKITLLIDGENKDFTVPFINGMVWRKFIEMKARMDMDNLDPEEVDELVDLVVFAYGGKFSREQVYMGVPQDKVLLTIDELFAPSDSPDEEGNGKK
ncbi:hypothetical protein [Rossellomorea sp. DA94]|uniref:phage tail assembly chaperone G n=1 Tax=Rossellomorea sp. DA94 TaxID=3038653 RepID=UPI002448A173|nr:hypothetical protein [Rossellomorea sp. DA94]WGG47687.1 hypothetical protein P8596_10955 [Rossellomorea sp. DA94]